MSEALGDSPVVEQQDLALLVGGSIPPPPAIADSGLQWDDDMDLSPAVSPAPLEPAAPLPLASLPPVGELLVADPVDVVDDAPWLRYVAPRENDCILVDAYEERRQGVVSISLGDRLRKNGVAEVALQTMVSIMQDTRASFKTRLDAAERILEFSHGTPVTQARDAQVNVFVNVDV